MSRIEACEIRPVSWSDHNMVWSDVSISGLRARESLWKCNDFLLRDTVFREEMSAAIKEFFELNDTGEVDREMVWDAAKATWRGRLISEGASKKRVRTLLSHRLRSEIFSLERADGKEEVDKERDLDLAREKRQELRDLELGKIAAGLQHLRRKYYEKGDKADAMLVAKL